MMLAGAALPKDTHAVRRSIRGQVKGVCRDWPACTGSGYFTAAQYRDGRQGLCYCGSGAFLPAAYEACDELCPDLVEYHPDHAERSGLAHQGAKAWECEPCASCEHPRAPHLNPDLWYCRKCWGVNERQADGTLGWFRAGPFSPEAEKCNGLAEPCRKVEPHKAHWAPERIGPAAVDAIPF